MKIEAIICVLVGVGLIFFSGTPIFQNSGETKSIVFLVGGITVGVGVLIFWLFREPDKQIIYHRGL